MRNGNIGYFEVKNLQYQIIHRSAMFLWFRYDLKEVRFSAGGFVVLRFEDQMGVMGVLSCGP